jgi:iron-sulfur cluster assembly accessory protein
MVTLTQEATDKLRSLIAEEADPDAGLRVQVVPGGCSGFEYDLSLAAPAEGDEIVEGDGVRVIIDLRIRSRPSGRCWSSRRRSRRPRRPSGSAG